MFCGFMKQIDPKENDATVCESLACYLPAILEIVRHAPDRSIL